MSVAAKAKHSSVLTLGAITLAAILGASGCSQSQTSEEKAEAPQPAAAPTTPPSVARPASAEASEPPAETTPAVAPPESAAVQTAQASLPTTVKADEPVGVGDAADAPDHAPAPALSAEQQELAAEVGDTRHASAGAPASDKTPD